MPTWDRHVATPDLCPEELIDDITGWFDDLRGRWPDVEWWVQRIHGSILQQVNYVLITRRDFEAYARNPHGLMELGFRDPQLHTTLLPRLLNLYILRTFLAPLLEGIQPRLTLRAFLNGIALDHRLVEALTSIRKLNTWPSHTHNSCTDTLQYSLEDTSILTYGKTMVPQCISREAIDSFSAGRLTSLDQV